MRTVVLRHAYNILLKKLEEIKKDIKQNTKDIARAADFGDISENAEYDAAKERQSELFLTKNNLEAYVSGRVIDNDEINTEVVSFGTTLTLFDLDLNEIITYTLAGPVEFELEIYPSIMTFTSPLGQALNGKKKGAKVTIELPKRKARYLILDIKAVSQATTPDKELIILGPVGYDTIQAGKSDKGQFTGGSAYHTGVGAACFGNNFALVTRLDKKDKELLKTVKALNGKFDGVLSTDSDAISFKDIPTSLYPAKYIHLSAASPEQQLTWVADIKKEKKLDCRISVDVDPQFIKKGKKTLLKTLENCDIIFINESDYDLLSGIEIDDEVVIVKRCKNGTELWIEQELQDEYEAPEIEFVDSTGLNGVMAGVFLVVLSMGHDEETALDMATRIAAKSSAGFGVDHLLHVNQD
jgi:transcription elongation factor GreA